MQDIALIGTHSGSFHADDALGVAIVRALHPNASVVRSRDPAVWATCDVLVDVGGVHDVTANRFDHHQRGFNERRPTGIPFAGAGLVWQAYGERCVTKFCPQLNAEDAKAVAAEVDARLIAHADAVDSGVEVPGPIHFGLAGIVSTFNSTWQDSGADDDRRFTLASALAGTVLKNLLHTVSAEYQAAATVRVAPTAVKGRVLVLDTPRVPYEAVVVAEMPEVLFVVYPDSRGEQYQVRVVPKVLNQFAARADLPATWAGLQGDELAAVTGVADSVFCHNGRFICGARSREGALALARLAVEALEIRHTRT